MSHRNHENLKIIFIENLFCVIRVLRGLRFDDDAEGGAVMGFGGFDEEAFLVTTKLWMPVILWRLNLLSIRVWI